VVRKNSGGQLRVAHSLANHNERKLFTFVSRWSIISWLG
jgi:hypothetical protein